MRKPAIQRLLELLALCSLRGQYRIARALAFSLRHTPNQISQLVRENLRLCFPAAERAEQERLYRAAIEHTCYAMTELAAIWCWPPEKVLARITTLDICDEFAQAQRGRIILAPHLGSWEMLVLWLGQACQAMILYKPRRKASLDRFMRKSRARTGGTLVPTEKKGLRKLLLELKNGGSLMILPDQKPPPDRASIDSSFFGVSAPTTTLVQNLCSKVDCDVFLATIYRASPLGDFCLRLSPLQHAALAAEKTRSARYLNDQIAGLVAEHVEQYQWGYRRFAQSAYDSIR